jgi:hypothetical protein
MNLKKSEAEAFIQKVAEMRKHQKLYFKTKPGTDKQIYLVTSKKLEKEVDDFTIKHLTSL